jgi:hypothetical protein
MVSSAARSSSVSRESRWSGLLSRTSASPVPHVLSRQENSTRSPASSRVSSTERSGGTVRGEPGTGELHLESLEGLARVGPVRLRRAEPLDAQRAGGPVRTTLPHRPRQGFGTAGVRCPPRVRREGGRPGPADRTRPAGESGRATGGFTRHVLPGDHFFLHSARTALLDTVRAALTARRATARGRKAPDRPVEPTRTKGAVMNTTEPPGLMLPRCCAHLMAWRDGPLTARTPAVATRAGLPAETPAPESATAFGPGLLRLSESRVVRT